MKDEDFKKKFEEANPELKLVRRTKERTIASAKRIKFALTIMALFIFCGVLTGAPIWIFFTIVPFVGIIGYFGARDSKAIDDFFKDF